MWKGIDQDEMFHHTHDQDEIYMLASGSGTFVKDGEAYEANAGDLIFCPAGVEHYFENYSEDFVIWIILYGRTGGE